MADDAQDDDFDSSPRPAKKRRLTGDAAGKSKTSNSTNAKVIKTKKAPVKGKKKAVEDFVIDDEDDGEISKPSKPAAKPKRKTKKKADIVEDDEDEDAFDPPVPVTRPKPKPKSRKKSVSVEIDEYEYDEDNFAKPAKPKHRIHIPVANTNLPEIHLGDGLPPSSDEWGIRGPIWKIPPPPNPVTKSAIQPAFQPAIKPAIPKPAISQLQTGLGSSLLGPPKQILSRASTNASTFSASVTARVTIARPTQDIENSEIYGSDVDEDALEASLDFERAAINRAPRISFTNKEQPSRGDVAPVERSDKVVQPLSRPAMSRAIPFEESEMFDSDDDADALQELLAKETSAAPERITEPTTKPSIANAASTALAATINRRLETTTKLSAPAPAPIRQTAPPTSAMNAMDDLGDLPSDAFSDDDEFADLPADAFDSSPSSFQGTDDVVIVSATNNPIQAKKPKMAAPLNGLRQLNLFGGAVEPMGTSTQAKKKHAFPLSTQKEPPTHHQLDEEAIKTWVYPTNLGITRDYQYNIVSRGLFHNLLVALPTGLGKTFIAATVMLNWFRWTKSAQIVFVAPTKPLVSQQVDACFHIAGIPRSETVMLTGETAPGLRAIEWKEKRVFFMTPQTIVNDLKTGYCDPKRIVLLVVDEAHRATGNYAYVEVVRFLRRFNQSFRVLALTATPGSSVEAVQQVIDGLEISRTEIRTEKSIDIRQYVHARDIDTMKFDYSDEQHMIMDLLSKAIQPVLTKLNGQNAYWLKDPMKLTAFGCMQGQRQWQASDTGRKASYPVKAMVQQIFSILASLAHGISLLKFHGVGPFFRSVVEFRNKVDNGEIKGKYGLQIRQDENFGKMMTRVQSWVNNPDFLGHPKLEYLRGVVLNHFLDAGEGRAAQGAPPSATRVMIFAHWRDSAEEIVRVLRRNEPMIRPHVFVGQADSKHSEGMGQKKQLEVIQDFKDGKYNTLVATSIGEEGLDIGEVDLIVCYDASSSPIRMLQRMGRTGRKRKGNIALLVMRDKEDKDFEQAKDNYEKMQAMISDGSRFTYHDDKSPRIIPREIQPAVDKRTVEIPIENTQVKGLPEPKKKGRAPKRPPKKFHMPDNVRTGFVKASRMEGSDEELSDEENAQPKSKSKAKAKPQAKKPAASKSKASMKPSGEPEAAPLPFLEDVMLNKIQERELERKYQYVHDAEDGVPTVTAPRLDRFSKAFPGPTKYVKHGQGISRIATMMQRIRNTDKASVQRLKDNVHMIDLSGNVDNLIGQVEHPVEEESDDLVELPRRIPAKKKTPKAKAGGRGLARRNSSDMEGASSSPAPTPANMRIATQGIGLGSDDTMGADQSEEEPDSELEDFVVGSDAPIEMVSSSLPPTQRSRQDDSDADLPELGVVGGDEDMGQRRGRKRQIVDDDSDE